MGWNEEKVEQLKTLWSEGYTAHVIAEKIGELSRNAVIGKANRLNLMARRPYKLSLLTPEQRLQHERERHERWRRSVGIAPRGAVQRKCTEKPLVNIEDEKIPMAQRIFDCGELENHHCRWPVGEPGQVGFFFCGSPADLRDGRPYCSAHTLRALAPPRLAKKELEAA